MPKHIVRVTQVCRVTRVIELEIEALNLQAAIEKQQAEEDSPPFDDVRWTEHHDLLREDVDGIEADEAEQLARKIVQAEMADDYAQADQLRPRLRSANRTRRAAGLVSIRPTQDWYFTRWPARGR